MDIIERNIDRLLYLEEPGEREAIEPMSEWKWKRMYNLCLRHKIGPWIADGMTAYGDDFALQQITPALREQFLSLKGEKNPEWLERYELETERAKGTLHKLKPVSLQAYARDLMHTIQNIEE